MIIMNALKMNELANNKIFFFFNLEKYTGDCTKTIPEKKIIKS